MSAPRPERSRWSSILIRIPTTSSRVVTATGFSNPAAGLTITYRQLEQLGLGDVPVGLGPFYPTGCNIFGDVTTCDLLRVINLEDHFERDTLWGLVTSHLPFSPRYDQIFSNENHTTPSSKELYRELIDDGVTTVITTGPLTSLHDFQTADPESFAKIERLWAMAGNIDVLGNVYTLPLNNIAEYNVMADPVAAQAILTSSIPDIRLVPLDATNAVPMTRDYFTDLEAISSPEGTFISHLQVRTRDTWFSGPSGFFGEELNGTQTPESIADGYFLWDPLAAVLATDSGLTEWSFESIDVAVSTPIDLDNDGALFRTTSEDDGGLSWANVLTSANASIVRTKIFDALDRDCITGDQPLSLSNAIQVYEALYPEHGRIENNVFIPDHCDNDDDCPPGYACILLSPTRRNLRFGFYDGHPTCISL